MISSDYLSLNLSKHRSAVSKQKIAYLLAKFGTEKPKILSITVYEALGIFSECTYFKV